MNDSHRASRLGHLIAEAHRRSLWQVLAIYLAGSFGALQIVDLVAKNVGLPEWTMPFAVILLVIGFPIVMATAFVQEGGPIAIPLIIPEAAPPPASSAQDAAASAPTPAGGHRRIFTWRNAILGGGAAFALFGFTTAGYMTMRSMGVGPAGTLLAQGALPDRALLVVADLESTTGDTLLARASTEALRIDLAQSPAVRILEARQVAAVLRRMQRPPEARLNAALATEVAEREGASAVVAGEINGFGRGFVLTVRLLAAKNGSELIPLRENARDSTDVIGAIDRLSKKMRERIGESYRSLRSGQPLERVTTSSLAALRKYSQGAHAYDVEGNFDRAVALLTEATALDTAFAMAYRKLGSTLGNQFRERARAVDALTRAYQHRDRLPERERYLAEFSYFSNALYDPPQAILAAENMLGLDSLDSYALNNLGVVYGRMGEYGRAEAYFRAATRADSVNSLSWTNNVIAQANQGKFGEARATLTEFAARFPGSLRIPEFRTLLESAQRNYDVAERIAKAQRDSARGNTAILIQATLKLSDLAAVRGRVAEANQHMAAVTRWEEEGGRTGLALDRRIESAALDVYVRRQPAAAQARLEEALRRTPLSKLHPLERPYASLAIIFSASGRADRARQLLDEYDGAIAHNLRFFNERTRYVVARAELAIAEGRTSDAIETARSVTTGIGCARCPLPTLAAAYEAAQQPDSAIAVYERYLALPFTYAIEAFDRWDLAATYEHLGQLYDAKGNTQKAAEYYGRFVELWGKADPELQPRVTAARNRLTQLVGKRG